MKKILTTVCLSSAILFGQCSVKGTQIGNGLAECADAVRAHLKTIEEVMDDDFDASETHKDLLNRGEIDKAEFERREFKAQEDAEVKIRAALEKAACAFRSYRDAFPKEKVIDFLEYVTKHNDAMEDEHVVLFNEFLDVIEGVIADKYLDRDGVDTILRSCGTSFRSLGLKNCLDMYTLFNASRYFDSIEDHVNFVMSSKRLRFNMERFFL